MTKPSVSSEEIDTFVPPDILSGRCSFNDFAGMLYEYRNEMDYNSRLILIFAKKLPPEHQPEASEVIRPKKISPYWITLMNRLDANYRLVSLLLSTRNKELIHIDKHTFMCIPDVIANRIEKLYSEQVKKYGLLGNGNFRIIHVCVGYEMYTFDERYKLNDSTFNRCENYRVQEHLLKFIRKEGVIDKIEYARQSFAYYNTELPKLMKFINANLEMILADVGDPKLLRLLEEDREKDKYHFITRKEQLLRIKIKRKEELEAELQDINAEIKSLETEN